MEFFSLETLACWGAKSKRIAYYTKKTPPPELPKKIELSIYQAIINTTENSKKKY
jgi:hypothetical protein